MEEMEEIEFEIPNANKQSWDHIFFPPIATQKFK